MPWALFRALFWSMPWALFRALFQGCGELPCKSQSFCVFPLSLAFLFSLSGVLCVLSLFPPPSRFYIWGARLSFPSTCMCEVCCFPSPLPPLLPAFCGCCVCFSPFVPLLPCLLGVLGFLSSSLPPQGFWGFFSLIPLLCYGPQGQAQGPIPPFVQPEG